jgi:thiol:disulfide interchange protein DsbC
MKIILAFVFLSFSVAFPAAAFPPNAGEGRCIDCHSLTVGEASALLKDGVDRVLAVAHAEVPGMWVVDVEKNRQKFPLYVDYSKQFVFTGNIIRLNDHQNITAQHAAQLNRVDVARVPVDDALVLGRKAARTKVIVITDPDCPFCKRLHDELKEVVRRDPEIAFLIKFYPLKIHPNAYEISKSIVCARSLDLLEAHFAGKPIPPAKCDTKAIDQNIALVQQLGITATPALILPDGLVQPGFRSADDILRLLGSKAAR